MITTSASRIELPYPPAPAPRPVTRLLLLAVLLGGAAFVWGLVDGAAQRAWQIYFVNFLFWTGIAQGGVAMAGVYRMTNARWGDHFRRIGEGMIAFLPVSLVLYGVLVAGGGQLFPWLHHEFHGKEMWLNGTFVFARDGAIFLFMLFLSAKFVGASVRPDLGLLRDRFPDVRMPSAAARLVNRWEGWEVERGRSDARLTRLTPALLISFAVLYSFLGFDLVMSLDPHWFSTLFGWLFFLHAFFASLAVITILAVLSRRWFGIGGAFVERQWHDMGRFVFGFCLLSGGFFWSQFLVIWYGNLPEETSYLITRFYSQPWEPLMWAYIILAYMVPLAVFLSKRVKEVPGALLAICSVILIALFIERFVMVVPFVWVESTIPFGLLEVLVTIGFGAMFTLSWLTFASVVPLVPPDPSRRTAGH